MIIKGGVKASDSHVLTFTTFVQKVCYKYYSFLMTSGLHKSLRSLIKVIHKLLRIFKSVLITDIIQHFKKPKKKTKRDIALTYLSDEFSVAVNELLDVVELPGGNLGLVTDSILLGRLFTGKDLCNQCGFLTNNQGLLLF